jgi:hypothetical protein
MNAAGMMDPHSNSHDAPAGFVHGVLLAPSLGQIEG